MADSALKAFISYSHRDKRMRTALETHLSLLRRQGKLATWSDRLIGAGEPLDDTISEALAAADIVLMLVSADFIASEYCYGVEMRAGLAGHAKGTKRAIPIIVDYCDWKDAPFAGLKALPEDGKPIRAFRPQSRGWQQVAAGVRRAISTLSADAPGAATKKPAASRKSATTRKPAASTKSAAKRTSTSKLTPKVQAPSAESTGTRRPIDWTELVDLRRAWANCRADHYRDWYRDPWNWPEWGWLVRRDPTAIIRALDTPTTTGSAPIQVAKEQWKLRPGVLLQPLTRLVYQALTDAASHALAGSLRPWVFGVRLSRSSPQRGKYLRGDYEARFYRQRLNHLASLHRRALRADISDFFATVDLERLETQIGVRTRRRARKVGVALVEFLEACAGDPAIQGLPQRFIPSTLLASLFLAPVDDVLDAYAGNPGRRLFILPRVVRWVDDIWVFGRTDSDIDSAREDLEKQLGSLGLKLSPGKTSSLHGNDLVAAVASFELSAIDTDLAEDPSAPSLDSLIDQIVANPTAASRTHVIFACTRMRRHKQFKRVPDLVDVAHLLPQAADALARLFRESGAYRELSAWYLDFAGRFAASSDWAVAHLGSMFPSDEDPPDEVVTALRETFLVSGSVALTGLAAQRLVAWSGTGCREALREAGEITEVPHLKRIVALSDLMLSRDRDYLEALLGDDDHNHVTLRMLRDNGFTPFRPIRDFAGTA